jgi:23S rRNA pseudouridine2605 synthase
MERLQKVLAQAGIASRRAAEQIILAGRVRVDGRVVTELGTQVDPRKSRVEVDGNKIVAEKLVYIVLHKPRGVVCTLSDPEGRPTIRELIKTAGARLVPVGRLDFHTSGALLCTNDGEFAQGLAHPKREVPKVYVAKVKGTVDDDALERFGERIVIDGRPTQPAQVKRLRFEGDKTWLEITLREGRNRQVRRLGEATGFPVMRLARLSHAGIPSDDLRPGQWRELTSEELADLKKTYGVPKKVRSPSLDYTQGKAARGSGPAAHFEKQALRKDAHKKAISRARHDTRDAANGSDFLTGRSEVQKGSRGGAAPSARLRRADDRPFKQRGRSAAPSAGPRRADDRPFTQRGRSAAPSAGPRRATDKPFKLRERSAAPNAGPRRADDKPFKQRGQSAVPKGAPHRAGDNPFKQRERSGVRKPFKNR